ncbi:MCE family protein [Mycobacterium celatum]|uniref:MCE family protein n=1 Tax=Mycobacterium celatum TaxID=28045 RepID=A0A1X1RU54_MYCCE|nr:MCE family protein [Mycobacterium celatum]ORV16625.1 mammalian cell entry protein [Mycobacterium celatum]PIB79386.1 MCE family protein [Mycobacterium celatum]
MAVAQRLATRAVRCGLAGAATVLLVSGCQFGGLNSLDMPGTAGHGPGSFTVTVELPDVATLAQNSPVMVDDVTVGSVSGMEARQRPDGSFYAAVKLSLDSHVDLPTDVTVKVAQTSLLGSQHIELAARHSERSAPRLGNGQTIPMANAGRYPTTEEVLSSLGVVVNKGNLGALQDVTDELYNATAARAGQFADFLPRLAELAAAADQQSNDIVHAMEKLDRFTSVLASGNDKLDAALRTVPHALQILNTSGDQIVATFAALRRFATVAARMLAETKTDFAKDIKDLYPVVKALADNADQLITALPVMVTYPLPQPGLRQAVRGDYLNIYATFDLTVRKLGETLFTTSPLDPNMKHLNEMITPPDYLVGSLANLSGQAADPFKIPPAAATGAH